MAASKMQIFRPGLDRRAHRLQTLRPDGGFLGVGFRFRVSGLQFRV